MYALRIEAVVVLLTIAFYCVEAKLNMNFRQYKNSPSCPESYGCEKLYQLPQTIDFPFPPVPSIPCPARPCNQPWSYPRGSPTLPPQSPIPLGYEPWPVTYLDSKCQFAPSPAQSISFPTPCKSRVSLGQRLVPRSTTKFHNTYRNIMPSRPALKFMPISPSSQSQLLPPSVTPQCAIPGSCSSVCNSASFPSPVIGCNSCPPLPYEFY